MNFMFTEETLSSKVIMDQRFFLIITSIYIMWSFNVRNIGTIEFQICWKSYVTFRNVLRVFECLCFL